MSFFRDLFDRRRRGGSSFTLPDSFAPMARRASVWKPLAILIIAVDLFVLGVGFIPPLIRAWLI
jgi:hypothetical protein